MILDGIYPLFYIVRCLGCAPHIITEDDTLITKRGIFYSIACALIYFGLAVVSMYIFALEHDLEPKLLILTISRTVLSYVCLLIDGILTLIWNWKLRTVFSQLRTFDRATKFNENHDSKKTRKRCTVIVVIAVMFWTAVGYISYTCEPKSSIFNGLTYGIVNATISLQLMRFAGLSFLLVQRFHWLCEILLLPSDGKIMIVDRVCKQFRLQEVWWLHSCLANATETINSIYAVQLLLWIASMSFNTLSRIYTINEGDEISTLLMVRESLLVSGCAAHLLIIAVVCHATANEANRVGKVAFSPSSAVVGHRAFSQDNVEAAAYFQLREVHFFAAAGLIRVDLPLLLSLASGITTYLVILHAASS